jgi:hypothetical protein
MVDLEFTPAGRAEAVHALDRVDMGSVAGLRVGTTVPVIYPERDPRAARMSVGTRWYGQRAEVYIFEITYGIAGAIALAGAAAIIVVDQCRRLFRRL